MVKQEVDVSRLSLVQGHFVEQVGEMFLETGINKAILAYFQRTQVKMSQDIRRQGVTDKVAGRIPAREEFFEKTVVVVG